jgi:hypothetical protein
MRACLVLALVFVISNATFAATAYVIANDNVSSPSNSLTVYTLDTATGSLTQIASLATGGKGLGQEIAEPVYNTMIAVSSSGACIFAFDGASSDIAAFARASHFNRVGNYSDPAFSSGDFGGSISITPDGGFLYATYSNSQNIAAWAVNSDCSLTLLSAYVPRAGGVTGPLKVTPNGKELIVTSGSAAETFLINSTTGLLQDVGYLSFGDFMQCNLDCTLYSLDITKDSRGVVFAANVQIDDYSFIEPVALAAQITGNGLANPRGWTLKNPSGVTGNYSAFLDANAYAGNGNLYFGMYDGIVTASFTENPPKISATQSKFMDIPQFYSGASIAVDGNVLVQAEYPNLINTFAIGENGSLTLLNTVTLNNPNAAMFSLSIFPVSR